MKYFSLLLILIRASLSWAQNEITTPAGLPLKVGLLDATGNVNINAGSLLLNNIRYLSTTGARNIFLGEESGVISTTGADNTFFGYMSGHAVTTGFSNTFLGSKTGFNNTTGQANVFIGFQAGNTNTSGGFNNFIGYSAGYSNTSGKQNVFIGYATGSLNSTGQNNVFIGNSAGNENSTGTANTYVGFASVNANTTGERNTSLGAYTGYRNISGSGNIFIGNRAGFNELGSDKLYVSNSDTGTPLIYGDFSSTKLIFNGQVGAGTSTFPTSVTLSAADGGGQGNTSTYKLFVKGGILTEQLIIASGWADYVFDKGYKLKPLQEVESYIKSNGHLPNVPSAATVERYGVNIGDMTRVQQEKIEELTLYIIELEKQIVRQNRDTERRDEELKTQREEVKSLKNIVYRLVKSEI